MRVIEPGHIYAVANKLSGEQILTFFKDLPKNSAGHDGILCQEVLRVLIDRVHELNKQQPCHENIDILSCLRQALILFETRAARRTMEKSYSKSGFNIEQVPVRPNGHIFDLGE